MVGEDCEPVLKMLQGISVRLWHPLLGGFAPLMLITHYCTTCGLLTQPWKKTQVFIPLRLPDGSLPKPSCSLWDLIYKVLLGVYNYVGVKLQGLRQQFMPPDQPLIQMTVRQSFSLMPQMPSIPLIVSSPFTIVVVSVLQLQQHSSIHTRIQPNSSLMETQYFHKRVQPKVIPSQWQCMGWLQFH